MADGISAHIVSGAWNETEAPIKPLTDIYLAWIDFKKYGQISFSVPVNKNILLYVVKGQVKVNQVPIPYHHLVEFTHDHEAIMLQPEDEAIVLFGYATPFNEPFVAYGPFVMNTREEIRQAYDDYNRGLFEV